MNLQTQKNILKKYQLKDGQMVTGSLIHQISAEQKLTFEETITLLGIDRNAKYRLKRNANSATKIKIKTEQERENIREKVKNKIQKKEFLSLQDFQTIEKQTEMVSKLFLQCLGINSYQYKRVKSLNKSVNLRKQPIPLDKNESVIIQNIKFKDYITKKQVEKIRQKYQLTDQQIVKILKTSNNNYKNLMKGKTKKLKIDLLSQREKKEVCYKLKQYKNTGVVTIEDLKYIKKKIKATDKLIKEAYGIKPEIYCKLLKYKISTTKIKDLEAQRKVNLLKIELKHNKQYGERYYSKKELKRIAKEQKIDLQAIMLYLFHPSYYFFNSIALEKNKEGFWIGENRQITNEFWEENVELLQQLSKQAAYNVSAWFKCTNTSIEDLQEMAYTTITSNGLLIEKNFKFDKKLQNTLLRKKGKHGILKMLFREKKLYHYQQYEEVEERWNIFADNTNNPNQIIENTPTQNIFDIIKDKKQKHLCILIQKYQELMRKDRKQALTLISKETQTPIQQLNQMIIQLKKVFLTNKLIKKTNKGNYITMTN